ncbi:MAG: hypothetical protein GXP25_09745 [Planctomycetes bacterium]|nr:hypothetical protein [Planctomycetota bacterium]
MAPKVEEILDQCIDAVRSGKSAEGILARHPGVADDVRPLVSLADELGELPGPSLSLRGAMSALARVTIKGREAKERRGRRFSWGFVFRAAAVLLCVLFVGWGTVTASSHAVPGDMLYPVKVFTERVKFLLTISAEEKVELRIVFSEERLKEAVKKLQRGEGIDKALLESMLAEAKRALDESVKLPQHIRTVVVSRVGYLAAHQKAMLDDLEQRATPQEKKELRPIASMCASRCGRMLNMMKDMGVSPPCMMRQAAAPKERGAASPPAGKKRNVKDPTEMMRRCMEMCPMSPLRKKQGDDKKTDK